MQFIFHAAPLLKGNQDRTALKRLSRNFSRNVTTTSRQFVHSLRRRMRDSAHYTLRFVSQSRVPNGTLYLFCYPVLRLTPNACAICSWLSLAWICVFFIFVPISMVLPPFLLLFISGMGFCLSNVFSRDGFWCQNSFPWVKSEDYGLKINFSVLG